MKRSSVYHDTPFRSKNRHIKNRHAPENASSTGRWPRVLALAFLLPLSACELGPQQFTLEFVHHPHEDRSRRRPSRLARFAADPRYQGLFTAAFPEDLDPYTNPRIAQALASFQRTLISGNSPYDRYTYGGDSSAMTDAAKRGMGLFFSEKTECYHCHSGINFTTSFQSADSAFSSLDFHNTGLYNIGGTGDYPSNNVGLIEFTGKASDMGKFRVPTLRNVEVTGPYMHDGSITSLEDVINHYNVGGRTITEGPYAGVGAENPYKDPLVRPMNLTE